MFINPSLWSNSFSLNSFDDLSPFPLDISSAKNKAGHNGHKLVSKKVLGRFQTALLPSPSQMTSFLSGRSLWGPAKSSAIKIHTNKARYGQCPVFSLLVKAWEPTHSGLSFPVLSPHAHTVHIWFQTATMPAQTSNPGKGRRQNPHTAAEGWGRTRVPAQPQPGTGAQKSRWFSEQPTSNPRSRQLTQPDRKRMNFIVLCNLLVSETTFLWNT